MSRPFAKNNGKTAFCNFNEPFNSNEYITNKKAKYLFCNPHKCRLNKNLHSQSNYLIFKKERILSSNPCSEIDPSQLYINLITKLDLSDDIIVVTDLSNNNYPVQINKSDTPYLKYDIDPNGSLFGNNICGINNYENYIAYNGPTK